MLYSLALNLINLEAGVFYKVDRTQFSFIKLKVKNIF